MIRNPAKALLRTKVKQTLRNMSPESRKEQSEVIFKKVLQLPSLAAAQRISIYLSTETEVNTLPILEELLNMNKQVFVPTYDNSTMEMVQLYSKDDYASLPLTKWNIKQPVCDGDRENALQNGLDLILLPGVAFTKRGGRCGHGMGYYDKFLERLFTAGQTPRDKVKLIGLAFAEQMVDAKELPLDDNDVMLDEVITSL